MPNSIFIIGGEESGDGHGASLITALKKLMPGLSVEGMGGARMREAGLIGLDSREVSVVGVVEVIEKLPTLWRSYATLKRRLAEGSFDAVVLIDFPDFNLRIAKAAKKLGIPVIYYISPQVWAWRRGRIKTIAALVKKMLVVFPFEVEFYKKAGVDVEYVGHPLGDRVRCELTRQEAREQLGIAPDAPVIALLPGSRTSEVERILPVMLQAAKLIQDGLGLGKKRAVFPIIAANSVEGALLDKHLKEQALLGIDAPIVRDNMYPCLRAVDAAIVTSGTATLETALVGAPMVIVYRLSGLTYWIARVMVKGTYAGLPNIIAGKGIVPELMQDAAKPQAIADKILGILKDLPLRERMIRDLQEMREKIAGGASERAARAIKSIIRP
ncbi:MAG: lipid-A-disaccharide synthase [Deltaproteobacteria bacterium]|nr:lipid-A-disaccharide synthase [Deltaproteobacteria bacterium]